MTLQQEYWWITDGLKSMTPLCVGLAVAYIAWRQWRTAHSRLKLDLFERRLKTYEATRQFLREVMDDGDFKNDCVFNFRKCTGEAAFLFPPKLVAFLDEVVANGVKLRANARKIPSASHDPESARATAIIDLDSELIDWLAKADDDLIEHFRPYIDLRDIK